MCLHFGFGWLHRWLYFLRWLHQSFYVQIKNSTSSVVPLCILGKKQHFLKALDCYLSKNNYHTYKNLWWQRTSHFLALCNVQPVQSYVTAWIQNSWKDNFPRVRKGGWDFFLVNWITSVLKLNRHKNINFQQCHYP